MNSAPAKNVYDTRKRIAFLIPTLYGGGAERVTSELSSNIPDDIAQYLVLFEDKISYPYKASLIVLNADSSISRNLFVKLGQILKRFIRFRRVVKMIKPDTVFSLLQGNAVNMLVKLSLPASGYRAVISERTATSNIELITKGLYGFLNRTIMRMLYNRADSIIAVSEGIREDLSANFGIKKDKIRVVYNPVDTDKLCMLAGEDVAHPWFSAKDMPVIINMGRLTAQKNQKDLLTAFLEVRKKTSCRLVIIGEGDLKDELVKLSEALGIASDVLFLGFQKNPFKYISRSDIFVLSSSFEGFPNALAESMAVGCPVISSDCPTGPREILAPGTQGLSDPGTPVYARYGVLFKAGDIKAMTSGIERLLEDNGLRADYARLGRSRMMDFNIKKTVENYMEILLQ
jgi:glycosyltransferase involved in cell wall biosynthesis